MRLSEAIRAGSKLRPASESGWDDLGPDGQVRTCALVAAAEAGGLIRWNRDGWNLGPNGEPVKSENLRTGEKPALSVQLPAEWAAVTETIDFPPCACRRFRVADDVMAIIWHLHDVHRWSREAVAEWIETIERAIDARVVQAQDKAAKAFEAMQEAAAKPVA